ncbi:hemagglutinin repeat-containing protein [Burkholderia sp. 22PA0099]
MRGDFRNTSDFRFDAGHDFTFTLPGSFTNDGGLLAVNALRIDAGAITNRGSLVAGGKLATRSQTLDNLGSLVGGSVSLRATSRLTNVGPTALIGATDGNGLLELLSRDIQNRDDTTATDTPALATILGLGRVVIAGGQRTDGSYTNAGSVLNQSALIQSDGDMALHADRVTNTRRHMATSGFTQTVAPATLDQLGISMSGQVGQANVKAPDNIGGVYIEPPHGGKMNSDYLFTTYTGTARASAVTTFSPEAQIVSGGKLGASSVENFQNYWSRVAAAGDIEMPKALDQNSWRDQAAPKVRVTYTGQYHYRTYKGKDWTYSFCDTGCNASADIREFRLPAYESSWVSNGKLSGNGIKIDNPAGNATLPSLGLKPGQALPGVSIGDIAGDIAPGNRPTVGHAAAPSGPGAVVDPVIAGATAVDVLTHLTIPQGGLFQPNRTPDAHYVIETNPAFTSSRKFLSSDYYLQQLGLHPDQTAKRLGDGFYEQQLVRNQVTALTGKAVLGPYADLELMYESLLGAGASLATSLDLPLGASLSPEQVAQLTRNVILMESRVVDGQTVLVPVVYLAKASQSMGEGPLIAASDIDIRNATSFTNSGTLRADHALSISGDTIDNRHGTLQSGETMSLASRGDIDFTSADIKSGSLQIGAGRDLILDAATTTKRQDGDHGSQRITTTLAPKATLQVTGDATIVTGGDFRQHAGDVTIGGNLGMRIGGDWKLGAVQTGEKQVVARANGAADTDTRVVTGSSVKVGGTSAIAVDKDLTAQGARIDLGDGGMIVAGGNVSLGTANATSTVDSSSSGSGGLRSYAETYHSRDEALTGTTLTGGNAVAIVAGKDLNVIGSSIGLEKGNAILAAAGDVNIGAAAETHDLNTHETHSRNGIVSGSKVVSGVDRTATYRQGSTISADGVTIASGRDLHVAGSHVVGTNDVTLTAARDVEIITSQDRVDSSTTYEKRDAGLMSGGGLSVSIGSRATAQQAQSSQTTNHSSIVGSSQGNVTLHAGRDTSLTAAQVIAGQQVAIDGRNVTINAATDAYDDHVSQQTKQSGVSVGIGGGIVDVGQAMGSMVKAGTDSGDARLAAVQGVAAAETAYQSRNAIKGTAQALANGQDPMAATGIQLQIGVGSSHSSSDTTSTARVQQGASIIGNGGVAIVAHGSGQDGAGDLTMTGASVIGRDVLLAANRDVMLDSARSTESTHSSNGSGGWSAGASIGTSGLSVSANGFASHGQGDGDSVTHTNTTVEAGQTLTIHSGRDTTLTGAQASGDTVKLDVGRDLTMTTAQDSSTYTSNQHSTSGGIAASIGPGGVMIAPQLAFGHTGIDSDFASANRQTAITAGNGGFDIDVQNHTQLNGAMLASDAPADSNRLTTGGFGFGDVRNTMSYSASSQNVSLTSGLPSFAHTSDSASGTTHAAVGPATIDVKSDHATGKDSTAGLSRDTEHANQTVQNTFDLQKVQNDLAFQQAFGRVATFAVAEVADRVIDHNPQLKAMFGEGGEGRMAMHAAVAAIGAALSGGNVSGAMAGSLAGDALQSLAQPIIESAVGKLPVEAQGAVRNALNEVVATAGGYAGGAVAGGGGALNGAGAALDNEVFNRQLHPDEYKKAEKYAKQVATQLGISEGEAEGRILAELMRNSDQQTAQASGGVHDYEVRGIVGCKNLNCKGYANDPNYADHNYNSQYIAENQVANLLGRTQFGTGKTPQQLIDSNYDKDPFGNTIARAGGTLLAGSVTAGLTTGLLADVAAAWSSGTAFWYTGDALNYRSGLSKDQPNYQTAVSAGGIAAAFAPLTAPLNMLGTSAAAQTAVGFYNALVAGTGAYGTTAILNTAISPDLSGGIGVGTSVAGSFAEGMMPGPMGTALQYLLQILPGPMQATIENSQNSGIKK